MSSLRIAIVVGSVATVVAIMAVIAVLFVIGPGGTSDQIVGSEAPDRSASSQNRVSTRADTTVELVRLVTKPGGLTFTEIGQSISVEVLGVSSDGTTRPLPDDIPVSFSSSNPDYVAIDQRGNATALADGGAHITASYRGLSARVPSVVFLPAPQIPPFDPAKVAVSNDGSSLLIVNRIVVYTRDLQGVSEAEQIASSYGASILGEFPQLGSFLMEIEASSVDEMQTFLKQLSGDPKVEVAYPDNLVPQSQAITAEIAQYTVANAAYESVHLIEAWEIINGLPKSTLSHVNVSVIDDGMYGADCLDEDVDPDDANKTAIKEALESEFPNDDSNPVLVHEEDCEQYFDDMEHGTAVVSILAAKNHAPGQTYPFSGILSSAINLDFNVLFFDVGSRQYEKLKPEGELELFNAAAAQTRWFPSSRFLTTLNRIAAKPISVVNISYACVSYDECQDAMMRFAERNPNTLIVTSAGNDDESFWWLERDYYGENIGDWSSDGVMVVGGTTERDGDCGTATEHDDKHPSSDYGEGVTIAAPMCVFTINTDSGTKDSPYLEVYDDRAGTSFSTPLVTGTAALIFAIDPTLTAQEVKDILVRTASYLYVCNSGQQPCADKDLAWWRMLDAKAAVCEVLSEATGSSPPECLEERSPSTATPSATGTSTATTTPRPVKVRTGYCGRLCDPNFWPSATVSSVADELDLGVDVNVAASDGFYPIHMAAQHNANPDVAALLLDNRARIDTRNQLGNTPLHEAGAFNGPEIVNLLLTRGADINARNNQQNTPLHVAAALNGPEVIKLLMNNGADIHLKGFDDNTALHLAAEKNKEPIVVYLLLNEGANANAKNIGGFTPLHQAAEFNNEPAITRALLEHGADVDATSQDGQTALHRAAGWNEKRAVTEWILEWGADIEARDVRGSSPLHYAAALNPNPMIVELLLTEGADVGAKSNSGQTPLHSAAGFRTDKQVVELLMRLGADKDALTNDGQTPCDFAKAEDVRLLLCRETSSSGRALEREYLDQCVPYAAGLSLELAAMACPDCTQSELQAVKETVRLSGRTWCQCTWDALTKDFDAQQIRALIDRQPFQLGFGNVGPDYGQSELMVDLAHIRSMHSCALSLDK